MASQSDRPEDRSLSDIEPVVFKTRWSVKNLLFGRKWARFIGKLLPIFPYMVTCPSYELRSRLTSLKKSIRGAFLSFFHMMFITPDDNDYEIRNFFTINIGE